jgi:hypothetical protein
LRYSNGMPEREWQLAAPFIPPAKHGGRRWTTDMREAVLAVMTRARRSRVRSDICRRTPAASSSSSSSTPPIFRTADGAGCPQGRAQPLLLATPYLCRCRCLAKDWETTVASSAASLTIASIRVLTRRTESLLLQLKTFGSGTKRWRRWCQMCLRHTSRTAKPAWA